MKLPGRWHRRTHARTLAEHEKALTDLTDKDKIIDGLIQAADDLVGELKVSLGAASAVLRKSVGEAGDDDV